MKPKALLDTHCWLWLRTEPERLAPGILKVLANTEVDLFLSAASAWEIAIKYALGKLSLAEHPEVYVPRRMKADEVQPLPIEPAHALRVSRLPLHHKDPFDRILVAQAQMTGARLVTVDRAFEPYDVKLLWADVAPGSEVNELQVPYRDWEDAG